jgi:NADPH:quinone reductase-like Zn-dependent oxidoreductase
MTFEEAACLSHGGNLAVQGLLGFGKLSRKYKMHLVPYKANKDLNYLVELFVADKLKPFIDRCYPLGKTADAFRYFGEGHFKGKIVVTPGTQ